MPVLLMLLMLFGFAEILVCAGPPAQECTGGEKLSSLVTSKANEVRLRQTRATKSLSCLRVVERVPTLVKAVWITEDKSRGDMGPVSILLGLGFTDEGQRKGYRYSQRHCPDQQESSAREAR